MMLYSVNANNKELFDEHFDIVKEMRLKMDLLVGEKKEMRIHLPLQP